jgi:YHS domain-containing protein
MQVDPASAAGSHKHGAQTYYFCSPHCLTQFKADPARYVAGVDAPASETSTEHGAKYTCPMHPQIVRDTPGDCPICGMALVPIAGTGEADDSELRDLTRRFWLALTRHWDSLHVHVDGWNSRSAPP